MTCFHGTVPAKEIPSVTLLYSRTGSLLIDGKQKNLNRPRIEPLAKVLSRLRQVLHLNSSRGV